MLPGAPLPRKIALRREEDRGEIAHEVEETKAGCQPEGEEWAIPRPDTGRPGYAGTKGGPAGVMGRPGIPGA